ncbi:ATP-binding protein [Sandarakinorhabdus sp. AAP62]|uniref:sensor histidine kinase n=1 Tax=Sandarakinorhabdus sp. AAP62 TaxID=1248916 RepID=UPI0003723793|nr:ATP-binding protein [Sandarakinorhabdus sp. AAP62]
MMLPPQLHRLLDRLMPRTTTSRISLVLFLVLFSGSALMLVLLERATQNLLDRDAQTRIDAIADASLLAWRKQGLEAAVTILDGELQVPGPLVIHLATSDGTLLLGNLARWPDDVPIDGRYYRVTAMETEQGDPSPYMVTGRPMPQGYRLLVGRSLEAEVRLLMTLTTILTAALPLAALLAWLTSRMIARIITDRAHGIADVVSEVTGGNLHARVDLPPGPPADAFDSMGAAFNVMLARVESVLDELRAVTDGLAHDLRSPLTRLKARIDKLGLGTVVDAADLSAVSAEAESLLAMLDNSLEISRAEAGIGRDRFEEVDLSRMIADLADMYEPLAEDAGVALKLQPGLSRVTARAHRQLLGRALANLIDNALRYGAAGKVIELGVEASDSGARLLVADHGPGIPASQRHDAIKRFGRLDAARGRQGQRLQGAGLGLSLAAAVARLHGGSISLADNNPGLLVAIDLPVVPAAE